ncbi:MAG: S46 family peptidase [Deltaproteobacteria bacterium]|nr:S46 family peptidase [Deltaproteobacteria bacterium]
MRIRFPLPIVLIAALWLPDAAHAEEGMFMPSQFDRLPAAGMARQGLKLTAAQLRGLEPAIAQVARGGTGSFVSADGLLVTNHHVAYGCIARLDGTAAHKGVMTNGYLAKTKAGELSCPGYDMLVVQNISDVTAKVLSVVRPRMTPKKRFTAVLEQSRRIERTCEKAGGVVCEVKPADGGVSYTLSVYQLIKDVRLVYAPPKALGKFGGDVDNWRYPRHTPDFSFLRAYVSKNGKGVPFAKTNVPYRPKKFLKVATSGVRRNDLVLVMGFPGRTMRHTTYYRARYYRQHVIPYKKKLFGLLLKAMPHKGLSGRRYQGLDWGLNNAFKYYTDLATQFDRFKVLDHKKRQLAAWKATIASDPKLKATLSSLLPRMEKIYADLTKVDRKSHILYYLSSRILRSIATPVDIVTWARVKRIPDLRREQEQYRDKNMYRVYRASKDLELFTTIEGERRLATAMFTEADKLPASQRIATVDWLKTWTKKQMKRMTKKARRANKTAADLFKKETGIAMTGNPITDGIALMYARTKLYGRPQGNKAAIAKAVALRKKMFRWSRHRIARSKDPLMQLAVHLAREQYKMEQGPLAALIKVYRPLLWPELVSKVIRPNYLDANFTLRLNYGHVRDYTNSVTHKRWRYLSRLTWLVRKDRGKEPFLVPPRLKQIYRAKNFGRWVDPYIKDVPVDFTATLDTTGGNSGSPVLNGRGELIGLLFDGTPESIVSDWRYLNAQQRSICVDIRMVLFLADKFSQARNLLKEMGL